MSGGFSASIVAGSTDDSKPVEECFIPGYVRLEGASLSALGLFVKGEAWKIHEGDDLIPRRMVRDWAGLREGARLSQELCRLELWQVVGKQDIDGLATQGWRLSGGKSQSRPAARNFESNAHAIEAFVTTWNSTAVPAGEGFIPKIVVKPIPSLSLGSDILRTYRMLARNDNETLLAQAMIAFALEPFHRERRYGCDTFCRHAQKWADRVIEAQPALADLL